MNNTPLTAAYVRQEATKHWRPAAEVRRLLTAKPALHFRGEAIKIKIPKAP